MPNEESAAHGDGHEHSDSLIESAENSGINQQPPRGPLDNGAPDQQEDPNTIEHDIRVAEYWLIGVGIASVLVNILIGWVYWQQLGQMRVATEASTRATELSRDALEYANGNFDRNMRQVINQTVAQLNSARDTQRAANASIDSSTTNKAALIEVQRAFMSPTIERTTEPTPESKNPTSIDFNARWVNEGATPAIALRSHFSYSQAATLPDISRDILTPGVTPQNGITHFLFPKQYFLSTTIFLTQQKIAFLVGSKTNYYVWGWAKYHDVFKGTEEHITRYCYVIEVSPVIDIMGQGIPATEVSARDCDVGNCADKECTVNYPNK
jgi:hypothetical protein